MSRKRRISLIFFILFLLLIGLPALWVYWQVRQERLDHALIAAIKARDNKKTLELLVEGASGEARDTGKPPTFKETLLHLLDHFRHPGAPPPSPTDNEEHLPALLLHVRQPYDTEFDDSLSPDLAVVRALLDHGARVDDRDSEGKTALRYAAWFSNGDIVRLLLARGADIEAKSNWPFGDTPLNGASEIGTRTLLEHGANIEAKDDGHYTPLLCSVWYSGHRKHDRDEKGRIMILLLEHGANIEARDYYKRTALILAVKSLQPDLVRILLEHKAKVSPKDAAGKTALDSALGFVRNSQDLGAHKIEALLRKYGAK